jgi:hypothetical protein
MEAENYLSSGFGVRLSMESKRKGWKRLREFARVWQPSRLKGIQVSASFGVPFLGATQVFDLRPVARKWLSLDRTEDSAERFVRPGTILVTCSGLVGRATLANRSHENMLVSHDLLRVDPIESTLWGWLYAYLRASQTRSMMKAAQYGHIIKHLETSHLDDLPVLDVDGKSRELFNEHVAEILELRNRAYECSVQAEAAFELALGSVGLLDQGENGFTTISDRLVLRRRRLDAWFHNPAIGVLRAHLAAKGDRVETLSEAGFDIWLPTRFKRIAASQGVELLESSALFEVNPDITKRIADSDFGDPYSGRVRSGWMLLSRSGQIYGILGSLSITNVFHEGKVASDDLIRLAPNSRNSARAGYVYTALSHPTLGRPLVKALAYGSSIPHIEPSDLSELPVVRLSTSKEDEIADRAEQANSLRAEADILEKYVAAEADRLIDAYLATDWEQSARGC